MPARLHPGVYVEEVPSGARSIEAAGTSTAIFVGETERGPVAPTKIKGVADYERQFGGYKRHGAPPVVCTLRYAMDAFFQNGGSTAYILRGILSGSVTGGRTFGGALTPQIVASSPGTWSTNVRVISAVSSDGDAARFRLFVIYQSPGGAPDVIVERWDRLSASGSDENYASDVLQRSLYIRWNPDVAVAIPALDIAANPVTDAQVIAVAGAALVGGTGGDINLTDTQVKGILGRLDEISDAALLVIPSRPADADTAVTAMQKVGLDYAEGRLRQDLFCVADMPRLKGSGDPTSATNDAITAFSSQSKTTFGGVYFPWMEVGDPVGVGRDPTLMLGPNAFVAGLFARTDQRRGVWKAPAGLDATVLGIRKLEYKLLDTHQDELNPRGINALRDMPAGGNVVWGARTLRPDSEWRYVPVRRMAIFLRTSIYNGIQWAVFEPNDEPLWSQLRLTIGGFMEQLFRQGAFAGRTTREAFFVKCDSETTPEPDRIAGIVNVWVGFAPLRPAEFVVVRLSQIVNQKA
ncbi:MAG: phage tail sheath family protein [Polyangiaceae bacterium]|nr:phage tail sheath family protein [Polyangiaceae bacterium]